MEERRTGWGEGAGGPRPIDYAAELNAQQYAAVVAPGGPTLVLAGAGSGKTRTLTYRVAYLLERGVSPERILLLTFTNKAAREMMVRVGDLLGTTWGALWGGTFHSMGARVLRMQADRVGYRGDYTILDRDDAEGLMKACLAEASARESGMKLPKPAVVLDGWSRAVNERKEYRDILERQEFQEDAVVEVLVEVGEAYTARKRASNVMDFDDLLWLWLRLMEENEDVRERYQERFQWVLVDEFQDTNQIQSDLVDLLAGKHRNLMAVGDDAQSIYSWRGANFRNILQFSKRYPEAQIFRVETNYRSTPEILALANAAIAGNRHQFPKELTAVRPSGPRPEQVRCADARVQASLVAARMLELTAEGVPRAEMVVLYRSHFHALEMQMELTRQGIPFAITSGIRFFEQAHIKDVAAWLKLLANPTDETAFKRMVLMLPGIGAKAAERLGQAFREGWSMPREASAAGLPVAGAGAGGGRLVPKKAAASWATVVATVAELERPALREQPEAMIRKVVKAFYAGYAVDTFPNASGRLEELEQMAEFASGFPSLTEFLTQLSLMTDMEAEAEDRGARGGGEAVRLSTVHQAKGLEFQVVFVIMLADGLFPTSRSLDFPEALEEERRLFYVAVTRARDELYLMTPAYRSMGGPGGGYLLTSRFLQELPAELYQLREAGMGYGMTRAEALEELGRNEDEGTDGDPDGEEDPY
jgi:DNA helicase-2/ATP-dependent DNA helicase PcrA